MKTKTRRKYKNITKNKNNLKTYFPQKYFYMFSKKLYKKNNKVIENITQEVKNNKLSIKGYINGKKINRTKKLFPNFVN